MKLIQIDKARYRKHLNQVIIACVIALAVAVSHFTNVNSVIS